MICNKLSSQTLEQRQEFRERDSDDPRGVFFRDATAIMHATSFRRLKHKTQVFFAPSNDHVCTRQEHALHVASIGVTICKALGLNTDLAWAIGLGHDLGHAPFGHLGEVVIAKLTNTNFCHELHSLRVVDKLAKLNLCYGVRDGIVTHCGELFEQAISPTHQEADISGYTDRSHYPASFEGAVIRVSDKIAYLGRDYEDAVTLGILDSDDMPLPVTYVLGGYDNSSIINSFALDVIKYSKTHGRIGFSDDVHEALVVLKEYNYKNIYKSQLLEEQSKKFEKLLTMVFEILHSAIETNKEDLDKYLDSDHEIVRKLREHIIDHSELYNLSSEADRTQALIDYVAGMTDDYVISTVRQSLFPQSAIHKL